MHCYDRNAGWSSLVARWAHNPKVGGSNPPPATKSDTMWTLRAKPVSVLSCLACELKIIGFCQRRHIDHPLAVIVLYMSRESIPAANLEIRHAWCKIRNLHARAVLDS